MTIPVHFVGSIALDTPDEVFEKAGELLGPHLRRVPDGEPGGRRLWIAWQIPVLRANESLTPAVLSGTGIDIVPLKLKDGVPPGDVHFGELGYAREARASYLDFRSARDARKLPPGVRFQVSLPTPYAIVNSFCVPGDAQRILPSYEQAMLKEVERICRAIPHDDLALQWDVCIEMLQWDGRWQGAPQFPGMEQVFAETFGRLSRAVPDDVELGFHLCYGDLDAAHFVEPVDLANTVRLANLILDNSGRRITYVHMPVPLDRDDEAYFAPLRDLRRPDETELYLGLVHVADGVEGTRRRMVTARRFVPKFGIASECGISRGRSRDVAIEFMRVYAGAAASLLA